MAENIEVNAGSALARIEIKDEDGLCVGFLKINLTNARTVRRMLEISDRFKVMKFAGGTMEQLEQLDAAVEEQFCYLLGYDCRETLFGILSPTSFLSDGEMYAVKIIKRIAEMAPDEIKRRAETANAVMQKHTAKYQTPVN